MGEVTEPAARPELRETASVARNMEPQDVLRAHQSATQWPIVVFGWAGTLLEVRHFMIEAMTINPSQTRPT